MTAPSQKPTEAMRSRAWDAFAEIERAPLQAPEIIARALMEQDAAARREGFAAGLERAAREHENVNPASDEERSHGIPGAEAMGAVIEYRDRIRALEPGEGTT